MNKIRAIQELNKKEIEQGISPDASWHVDYRDTAFVYFGGLPYELSEGDIITIFSQFGEPVFLRLVRDKETGESRGFGWLKFEDQRSTDLAVDNLVGATINGRMISVDHARYKPRDDKDLDDGRVDWEASLKREQLDKGGVGESGQSDNEEMERRKRPPLLKEKRDLILLEQNYDDDDPMKEFLIEKKRKEVEDALRRQRGKEGRERKHKSRNHRTHHSSRLDSDFSEDRHRNRQRNGHDEGQDRKKRSRQDDTPMRRTDNISDRRESRRSHSPECAGKRERERDDCDLRQDRSRDRRRQDHEVAEEYETHIRGDLGRNMRRRCRDRSRSPRRFREN